MFNRKLKEEIEELKDALSAEETNVKNRNNYIEDLEEQMELKTHDNTKLRKKLKRLKKIAFEKGQGNTLERYKKIENELLEDI